ncbi:hypothetical protein IPZ58_26215 [Streptomyces roseoverticillatus]|uniref:NACHT N-terminal Helical domain 1-containing protein n=1 Tax=Streptomyces roseoverticillatus TaxID=66429 RepID=UPI001F338E99|nr:hypothetical protein [Streptomyces roseoverticillatus]MCF3105059.1 hypothetical protein [Streptomyces roseoverticillatus]
MAGEAVLARVAGAVAGALAKSALARNPGAGLAAKAGSPVGWGRRRPDALGEEETSRLVRRLSTLRKGPWERLPENEWRAAGDAVCEVFAATGTIDQRLLFAADLDPERLRTELLARCPEGVVERAGLGEAGAAAFAELLGAACLHIVEHATSLPTFAARADVELVRRSGESQRRLTELLSRMNSTPGATEFDERYRDYIARTYGRVELFGLTLGCAEREWALSTAYISLKVTGGEEARWAAELVRASAPPLSKLQLDSRSGLDPAELVRHQKVRTLSLVRCTLSRGLAPLAELPDLTSLRLTHCKASDREPIGLAPLVPLPRLTVTVSMHTPVRGTELFPPERVRIRTGSGTYLI